MDLDESIQCALLSGANTGATVVDLIRILRERLGLSKPGEGRLLVTAYLTKTFGIPLSVAAEIGGWHGFEDGGQTTDEELQDALGSYILNGSSGPPLNSSGMG